MSKVYKYHCFIAGVKVPLIYADISSGYGTLASCNITLNYSPFITHLQKFTKIQVFEVLNDNGKIQEPTLEFDGVLIGITRAKNVLGNVSVVLQLSTDGVVWNQRKQYDFYLNNITDADPRGTDSRLNIRADGHIQNFLGQILSKNKFDVGCAACSVLTSLTHGIKDNGKAAESYFSYSYNGKVYDYDVLDGHGPTDECVEPKYYSERFFNNFKLNKKVYGISTSDKIKEYFKQDRFIKMLENNNQDLYGENTFWTIATKVLSYGFYDIFDIPNPTFLPKIKTSALPVHLKQEVENIDGNEAKAKKNVIPATQNRDCDGLAEYIFKPRSVIGIPFKCNVIWPDQIIQENLYCNFFGQPTRVLLKKNPLVGTKGNILTTSIFAGPHYKGEDQFLSSFNTPQKEYKNTTQRNERIRSEYEEAFGLNASHIHMGYAFDETLLGDHEKATDAEKEDTLGKVYKFLNYEFAQKFLSSRTYQIQVDPEVNPVCGVSTVVMNEYGEHVIAFCLGVRKSWDVNGKKTVTLNVAYPRFYYEELADINSAIDPTSTDKEFLEELQTLLGCEAITSAGTNNGNLKVVVEGLFKEYLSNKNIKKSGKFKRKVCTFNEYLSLFGMEKVKDIELVNQYTSQVFDSTVEEAKLSTNKIVVFDRSTGKSEEIKNLKNSDYVYKHLKWISTAKRI